ncbi:hypothetical protein DD563_07120 [Pelagicola sp. LXJ1103]|nr:hypothetical protein DD563_07120 [Pelagicola sp. LXJ1103]
MRAGVKNKLHLILDPFDYRTASYIPLCTSIKLVLPVRVEAALKKNKCSTCAFGDFRDALRPF